MGQCLVVRACGRIVPWMRRITRNVTRVFTGTESRSFDGRAIDVFDIPGIRLMHRAGRATFHVLRDRWPNARSITVVCGAGNNAGDGYVVAGLAKDAGLGVDIVQVGDPGKLKGDALEAARFAQARLGADLVRTSRPWRPSGDVVVDALLGTGVRGTVRADFVDAIRAINDAGRPVLAVDVPSGIDADSGGLLTADPVHADVTVTFVAAKLGLVTGDAVDYVGEVVFDDLDLPCAVFDRPGVAVLSGDGLDALSRRRGAHKGDSGRLLIVGGEMDMGGAVALAGEAALRTGVGLVSVATRDENRAAILARRPELMVRATRSPQDIIDLVERASAIAVGSGLGRGTWGRELLAYCAGTGKPLVVDADGLNIVSDGDVELPPQAVITPHPGEAGRLLGRDSGWVQAHRPAAAVALANDAKVAVLKGAGTLIAQAGALRSICVDGNPGMATAGSGDVLTGVVGALLARGLAPSMAADLGVWLHARAGDEAAAARAAAPVASDFVDALRLSP